MECVATPTESRVPLRPGNFLSLSQALEYAARGETGCNFYTSKGRLSAALSYKDLYTQASSLAKRLLSLGLPRGARVALVADTTPDFLRFFFACQFAGLVPVPLPVSIHLGGHEAYVKQLNRLLKTCKASAAMAPEEIVPFLTEASQGLDLQIQGGADVFASLPEVSTELRPLGPSELAYIQFTSGSTRWPRGVEITQEAVLSNLSGIIQHGLQVRSGDRCVSWLPFYHDMGLVGFVLGPLASQLSVDYLSTRDFAMRPRQWLNLMTQSRATISFSPSFGFELCLRRLAERDRDQFDLSHWRVAGVGAETVRSESLLQFALALEPSGFNKKAFVACYGMAECSLAISFAPLDQGLVVDHVDGEHLSEFHEAVPLEESLADPLAVRGNRFVNCGNPIPDCEVEVRDEFGEVLPERRAGVIYVKSPGVMTGYFGDPHTTSEVLSADGWLNTGDIGYRIGESLVIIGRQKDLIIINGKNIWPQDIEYLAEGLVGVRPGDASAFSVEGPNGEERAVVVIQCRESDTVKRELLIEELKPIIYKEIGIECFVELIPPRTLPRTSSGKLSRSRAREDFLKRGNWSELSPLVSSCVFPKSVASL
ncbi:MAG: fatty acyl-AMP ligase [Nitrospirales bacterium]|nr:fatty acyl-AMP ligase [Nitrospira sp.]MDR4503149.1 fatty acyl-AMP ligase [Nitrospirales bacterium]